MRTTNHPTEKNKTIRPDPLRHAQCHRHHVWMAACRDCRDSRIPNQRDAVGG